MDSEDKIWVEDRIDEYGNILAYEIQDTMEAAANGYGWRFATKEKQLKKLLRKFLKDVNNLPSKER